MKKEKYIKGGGGTERGRFSVLNHQKGLFSPSAFLEK